MEKLGPINFSKENVHHIIFIFLLLAFGYYIQSSTLIYPTSENLIFPKNTKLFLMKKQLESPINSNVLLTFFRAWLSLRFMAFLQVGDNDVNGIPAVKLLSDNRLLKHCQV